MFSGEFCKISKNTFSYRTPLVAASVTAINEKVIMMSLRSGAIAQSCYVKGVFLEISQNSQENASARVSFLIYLQA